MKIYIRILSVFLVCVLLLTGVGLLINWNAQQQYNTGMLEQYQKNVLSAADTLQEQLNNLDEQLSSLSFSGQTNLFAMYRPEKDWKYIYENSKLLHQHLNMIREIYGYVDSAFFLVRSQNRQITDRYRYDVLDSELYDTLLECANNMHINEDSVYLYYLLSANQIQKNFALVGMEISIEELKEYTLSTMIPQVSVGLSFDSVPEEKPTQWMSREDGWSMCIPIQLNARGAAMQMEVFLDRDTIARTGTVFNVWYTVILLVMTILLIMFGVLIRNIIAKPIRKILKSFDAVAQGDTSVRIHDTARGEFEDIYNHFNTSIEKLDNLIVREYQAQMAAQMAEIKHLQTQIQPHFLYNAFAQMYWLCQMEGCDQAAEYALLLSGYYEYITKPGNADSTVRLAEEIEHARKYIQIQETRFGDRLNVHIEADEACGDVIVPKLVLQPIIENSIKHCVERYNECKLNVRLTVKRESAYTVLVIEDDGKMLKDEDLESLQKRLKNSDVHGGGHGLVNVHTRLKLSGRSEGLALTRSEMGGLCLTIRFRM